MAKLFTPKITRPHLYNVTLSDLNSNSPLGSIADVVNGRIISLTKQQYFHRRLCINAGIGYQWDVSNITTGDAIFLRKEGDAIIERHSQFLFEEPVTVDSDYDEVILSAEQWERKKKAPNVLYLTAEEMREVSGKGFYPDYKKIFAYHDPAKTVEELIRNGYVASQVAVQDLSLLDQHHLQEKGYTADSVTWFEKLPTVNRISTEDFVFTTYSSEEDFDIDMEPDRFQYIAYIQNNQPFIFNGQIRRWFYAKNSVVENVWNFLLDGAKEQNSFCDDERSVYGRFFQVFAGRHFPYHLDPSSQALCVNFPDHKFLLPPHVGVMRYLRIESLTYDTSNLSMSFPLGDTRMNMLYLLKESATYPLSSRVKPPFWRRSEFDKQEFE